MAGGNGIFNSSFVSSVYTFFSKEPTEPDKISFYKAQVFDNVCRLKYVCTLI